MVIISVVLEQTNEAGIFMKVFFCLLTFSLYLVRSDNLHSAA